MGNDSSSSYNDPRQNPMVPLMMFMSNMMNNPGSFQDQKQIQKVQRRDIPRAVSQLGFFFILVLYLPTLISIIMKTIQELEAKEGTKTWFDQTQAYRNFIIAGGALGFLGGVFSLVSSLKWMEYEFALLGGVLGVLMIWGGVALMIVARFVHKETYEEETTQSEEETTQSAT